MTGELKQIFCTQKGPHTDGSIQWNVVHAASEERIGSFDLEDDAEDLANALNGACRVASTTAGAVIT